MSCCSSDQKETAGATHRDAFATVTSRTSKPANHGHSGTTSSVRGTKLKSSIIRAFFGSMRRSSMTFKITPVCRLKHSGTNGRYKKKKKASRHMKWLNPPARERARGKRNRQVQNVDAEIERGRDATLSRLILKFCTQEPAVNHTRTRRG